MAACLRILSLVCVFTFSECQATLYPGAADQSPVNNGAPHDMTQGWSPNIDKQVETSYLQTLRSSFNQINIPPAQGPQLVPASNAGPPPPGPPSVSFPAWLLKQFPALLPLHSLMQGAHSQTPPPQLLQQLPPQQQLPPPGQLLQLPQQQSPFLDSPPMPQPAHPANDQSLFGPQLPYNPQPPRNQMYGPPQHYMPRPGGTECSGGYMPGHLCCDGILNPLPPGGAGQWGCCHKGMYDMTTQVCCGDIPMPKPTKGPPMMCCGTMLYDPATHLCCDKFPVLNMAGTMRCCRKRPYNPGNEMCCGESVKPRLQMNMECCGKHTYNPQTHMCCGDGNIMFKGAFCMAR